MPPEAQQRPELGGHRSSSPSHADEDDNHNHNHNHNRSRSHSHSPSTTPPPPHQQHKSATSKAHKHVVGRTHARIPSTKSLHKLTKAHHTDSHENLKKLPRNSSASSLRKNLSHGSLKPNRSSADVSSSKRPRSSGSGSQTLGKAEGGKRTTGVHFEIGDQEQDQDQEDAGWEETSSSASPALSRAASRLGSHPSSAKQSAENSAPQSPLRSAGDIRRTGTATADGGGQDRSVQSARPSADAKVITERLLQRTPSYNTTKISMATATPTAGGEGSGSGRHSPGSISKSHSTLNGTPKVGSKEDMVSRFVGGSGTPSEKSPFLNNHNRSSQKHAGGAGSSVGVEEVKKSQSMGNLSRPSQRRDEEEDEDDSESALAPRSRKTSTTHAYNPPQQSRTQQKLWLQRASSNIEPQQMAPGAAVNGLTGLVGMGYDGRQDPRIKLQLERTGLEYLVVRRHQDPVGQALKRLGRLPGAEKTRAIAGVSPKKGSSGDGGGLGGGAYGLSQSLREARRSGKDKGARSSYDGGERDEGGLGGAANEDDNGVGAVLRGIWEKNYDLTASTD